MYTTKANLDAINAEFVSGWSAGDDIKVNQAIADAEAEIDGFLATRYPLPLNQIPANVKTYCSYMALANLLINTGVSDDNAGQKAIIQQADRGRSYFAKVSEGKIKLPIQTEENKSAPPENNFEVVADDPLDLDVF